MWKCGSIISRETISLSFMCGNSLHYSQNLTESVVKTVERTDNEYDWSSVRVQFPEGFYQVVIQGIRPDTDEDSGVALDDIYIAPCDEFRKWHYLLLALAFLSNNIL